MIIGNRSRFAVEFEMTDPDQNVLESLYLWINNEKFGGTEGWFSIRDIVFVMQDAMMYRGRRNDPRICIDFWLTGDVFDPDEITEALRIMPTRTRLKKDCPLRQTAATTWKLSTEKEESRVISLTFKPISASICMCTRI